MYPSGPPLSVALLIHSATFTPKMLLRLTLFIVTRSFSELTQSLEGATTTFQESSANFKRKVI